MHQLASAPSSKPRDLSGVLIRRANYGEIHRGNAAEREFFVRGIDNLMAGFPEKDRVPMGYFLESVERIATRKVGGDPRSNVCTSFAMEGEKYVGAVYAIYMAPIDALFCSWVEVSIEYEGKGLVRALFADADAFAREQAGAESLKYVLGEVEPIEAAGIDRNARKRLMAFGRLGYNMLGAGTGFRYVAPVETSEGLEIIPLDIIIKPLGNLERMASEDAKKMVRTIYETIYKIYRLLPAEKFEELVSGINSTIPREGLPMARIADLI